MIIDIQNLDKSFGAHSVLKNLSLKIEDTDRIGLIGENGAGKSTLLNIIAGSLSYDNGTIARGSGKRIGFLKQDSGLESSGTIESEMKRVFSNALLAEEKMHLLEDAMASTPHDDPEYLNALHEYENEKSIFESADGYNIQVKINTVLNGMGFSDFDVKTPVLNLSGGERTRLALAKLLLEQPDLLMLDEPTNHLDFKTLEWLEDYLDSFKGAILTISHDRYFLSKIVNAVCEMENKTLVRYNAGYTKYTQLKEERITRMQKEYDRQEKEILSLEDFIAKNKVRASTSNRAKSREATLARMERVEKPVLPPKPPKIHFEFTKEPVKDVLSVMDLKLMVGEEEDKKLLCPSISFDIRKGEKVALVGANGVGKSTLLKTLIGKLSYDEGRIIWGMNTTIGYYDQHNESLHPEKTMLSEMWDRYPRSDEHTLRTALARMRLVGDEVFKRVSVLSGGEKARLSLATLSMEQNNILVLDEPTNHMDIPCKEALDSALRDYKGTIIMVSHDRYLLNRVPTKIIEMFPDRLECYEGVYDDYLRLKAGEKPDKAPSPKKEKTASPAYNESSHRSREQRKNDVARKQRISAIEKEVMEGEKRIFQIQEELADPEVYANYLRMSELCSELDEIKANCGALMDEWAALEED